MPLRIIGTQLAVLCASLLFATEFSAGKDGEMNPVAARVLQTLDSTTVVETFLVSGPAMVINDSIPNIGDYPIVSEGPTLDSTAAQWLKPLVERVAAGGCGEPTQCEFDPSFALRFHNGSEPLDLLIELRCEGTIMFARGAWRAGYWTTDEAGTPVPGMSPYAACIQDSLEALYKRLFPKAAAPRGD